MAAKIYLAQDEESFLKKAAGLVMESAAAAIEERGVFSWALSGGNTPKKLFSLLSDSYYRHRINWTKIHVFWGDERLVPPNHPDSNYKAAADCLLSHVPIPSMNVHRIPAEMESAMEAARSYEQEARLFFKNLNVRHPEAKTLVETATGDFFPRFDFVFLGLGDDGHTASLFPGTASLLEKRRWVTGGRVESVGGDRITLTFPVLNNARRVVFLCAGEGKAGIVQEIFQNEESRSRFPAQQVRPDPGELIWILDRGAASRLPAAIRYAAAHI